MDRFFLIFILISSAYCDELKISSYPKSLEFKGNSKLRSELLSDVFSASLGYSVSHTSKWDGLYVKDIFNAPKAVVLMTANGIGNIDIEGSKSYELSGHSSLNSIDDLIQKSYDHRHEVVELDLKQISDDSYKTSLGEVKPETEPKVNYLKKSNKEDSDFLRQIQYVNGLSELLINERKTDKLPTLVIVDVSFENIIKIHSIKSKQFSEAKKLLIEAYENLQQAAEKAYDGSQLTAFLATEITYPTTIRHKRQTDDKQKEEKNPLNLAETYTDDYPVMFNIILWFSVILVFSLLAISIAISTMDPGRDSIIYRMTSTRMKKDN
uniref:Putative atpase membrane sector associated protein n=1 Tax=Corethrella appendiculata TaxID=1370023 RepID=U5EUB8_9DIPT